MVIVYAAAFMNITSVTHKRLNTISQHFLEIEESPTERRGGSRRFRQDISKSIKGHIKSFPVQESHYDRKGSCRQYLASNLSISQMYRMRRDDRRAKNLFTVQYSTYRKIFREKFNLSFRTPRTDICGTCESYYHKIRAGIDKHENQLQWKLHKVRAKKFYALLKKSKEECSTLTVAFDLQKNLPLPKTNVGIEYYSRQLWLYNLAIVIYCPKHRKRNVTFYSWMEHESGKGSNEVCSALADFLRRIRKRAVRCGYRRLALFSDGCPGQNKNSTMIAMLLTYVNSKFNAFREVTYTFPIRGHSYIPPDRVFANIEKKIRCKGIIASPEDYYEMIRQFGRLLILGRDWHVYDYRDLAESILQKQSKIGIQSSNLAIY